MDIHITYILTSLMHRFLDWVVFESTLSCLPSALSIRIEMIKNFPDNILLHSVTKSIISKLGYVDEYIDDVIQGQCMNVAAHGILLESSDVGVVESVNWINKVIEVHASKKKHCDHNQVVYHFASYFHRHRETKGILAGFSYNVILVSDRGVSTLTQFKNVLANYCDFDFEISVQTLTSNSIIHNECGRHNIYLHFAHQKSIIGRLFEAKDITLCQISMDEVFSSIRKDMVDKRVFWTTNTKAVGRMRKAILQHITYNPTLIHPTDFHHDISFWVNDCEGELFFI